MNSVNILDMNGQNITANLISYFKDNNKNYIFYTKNENVNDGLIKMYVAKENDGAIGGLTDEEWGNLKRVMQNIIMGNSNVTFLPYSNSIKINEAKAIALNDKNINAIKKVYQDSVGNSVGSQNLNKDMLIENFGGSTNQSQPVEISAIPNVQNNFNMESTPVNLNMNSVPSSDTNANINNPLNVEPINPVNSIPSEPLNINSIKPASETVGIDSGFKVSNEPNIFDQAPVSNIDNIQNTNFNSTNPFSITEEEVNKPIVNDVKKESVNVDNSKLIELNDRKIKLFEELANIYKEENDLLRSNNSDNTASNLFNNNGTLNEYEVMQ